MEIDSVTEKAQQLYKGLQPMRTSQITELTVKHQQVSIKVKDLILRWQQYVSTHTEYNATLKECQDWLAAKTQELQKISNMGLGTQSSVDSKLKAMSELLLCKDDGFAKVQRSVDLAQTVLANTDASGHEEIKEQVAGLRGSWSDLASKMAETKLSVDNCIHKWASFADEVKQLDKVIEAVLKNFQECDQPKLTTMEKRAEVDFLKNLQERLKAEKPEVEQMRTKTLQLQSQGGNAQTTQEGLKVIDKYEKLNQAISDKLSEKENQQKDYKAYKSAFEALEQYIRRCKDKLHTMRQRSPNDKNYVDAVTQALDHLLNKEAQGQILIEQLHQAGEIVLAPLCGEEAAAIKADMDGTVANFNELFVDIKKQKDQMGRIMTVFQDFKEETERLSDWMQQADINIKAAKTSLLGTLEEKEKAVRDMEDLYGRIDKGKEDFQKYSQMAEKMRSSCLEANVFTQLRETQAKFNALINFADGVSKKIGSIFEQHYEFEANVSLAR